MHHYTVLSCSDIFAFYRQFPYLRYCEHAYMDPNHRKTFLRNIVSGPGATLIPPKRPSIFFIYTDTIAYSAFCAFWTKLLEFMAKIERSNCHILESFQNTHNAAQVTLNLHMNRHPNIQKNQFPDFPSYVKRSVFASVFFVKNLYVGVILNFLIIFQVLICRSIVN